MGEYYGVILSDCTYVKIYQEIHIRIPVWGDLGEIAYSNVDERGYSPRPPKNLTLQLDWNGLSARFLF